MAKFRRRTRRRAGEMPSREVTAPRRRSTREAGGGTGEIHSPPSRIPSPPSEGTLPVAARRGRAALRADACVSFALQGTVMGVALCIPRGVPRGSDPHIFFARMLCRRSGAASFRFYRKSCDCTFVISPCLLKKLQHLQDAYRSVECATPLRGEIGRERREQTVSLGVLGCVPGNRGGRCLSPCLVRLFVLWLDRRTFCVWSEIAEKSG